MHAVLFVLSVEENTDQGWCLYVKIQIRHQTCLQQIVYCPIRGMLALGVSVVGISTRMYVKQVLKAAVS